MKLIEYNAATFLITLNVSILLLCLSICAFCCGQIVLGLTIILNIYQSFLIIRILKYINIKERTSNEKECKNECN